MRERRTGSQCVAVHVIEFEVRRVIASERGEGSAVVVDQVPDQLFDFERARWTSVLCGVPAFCDGCRGHQRENGP